MSLAERILNDYQQAMRDRDKVRVATLRLLRAAVRDAEIEARDALDDAGVTAVIQKQVKRRRDSIEAYRDGGRPDLAEQEAAELAVLAAYLPAQLDEAALEQLAAAAVAEVGATSLPELGHVMRVLMPRVRGQADGNQVNAIVRRLLGG
jgi:hypothetical protein